MYETEPELVAYTHFETDDAPPHLGMVTMFTTSAGANALSVTVDGRQLVYVEHPTHTENRAAYNTLVQCFRSTLEIRAPYQDILG